MTQPRKTAVWAVTPAGLALAEKLAAGLAGCDVMVSAAVGPVESGHRPFQRLREAVAERFHAYPAHVFLMSTGIAVRMIAPWIRHKTVDPAVVAVDDRALHAVSLLSGHIGGANALCRKVAAVLGARPVITTATDVRGVPAVDELAREKGLVIENPEAVKAVSMAVIAGEPVAVYDPDNRLSADLAGVALAAAETAEPLPGAARAGIRVDDRVGKPDPRVLVLRPSSLVAGMGCNRGTPAAVLRDALLDALGRFGLAPASLAGLATIDVKSDETGLLALARDLNLPLAFFSGDELNAVSTVPNPSAMVQRHVGVQSVCEAAAILGSRRGRLIVPKQRTPDTTVAVARIGCTSWASGPATSNTCPEGP